MRAIDWSKTTREDLEIIEEIVDRACRLITVTGAPMPTKMDLLMDIEAAHIVCPLRLNDLLGASDSNFAHDIGGIRRHLNRETGELEGCFLPRYAAA
jgi:hypothetical protein